MTKPAVAMSCSEEEIIETLSHYKLGSFQSVKKGHQGFANLNLRVETTTGTFLYRVNLEQSPSSIAWEHRLLNYLKAQGIPVALPIPRTDGEMITPSPHGPVVLYEFITGTIPDLTPNTVREIATASARLNALPVPEDLHRENPLSIHAAGEVLDRTTVASELKDRILRELDAMRDAILIPQPRCLVHGDLYHDNTLYQGDRLAAIIDFEEASTDSRLFEIGVAINGFCAPDNEVSPDLVDSFLAAYETILPLGKSEKALLPAYIHWGAHCMVCWHLKNPTPAKVQRIHWHLERLEQWKQHYPLQD